MKTNFNYKIIVVGVLTAILSASAFATTPAPYPNYIPTQLAPAQQVPLEAAWLNNTVAVTGMLPKSYDTVSTNYWGYLKANNPQYQQYLAAHDAGNCSIAGGNSATIERVIMNNGLDVYDGAVWQMALALAATNSQISADTRAVYASDVAQYANFLVNGLAGGFSSYRAFTSGNDGTPYLYNGHKMPNNDASFMLQLIAKSYGQNHDYVNGCDMNWPTWDAVTGEEAWSVLLGPVQSIYLLNKGATNPAWATDGQGAGAYIALGTQALGAISAMQDPNSGGVYRNVTAPNGAQDTSISLENNFSLYAGLSLLKQALTAQTTQWQTQINKLMQDNRATADKNYVANQRKMLLAKIQKDQDYLSTIATIQSGIIKFLTGQGGVTVYDKADGYFYSGVANGVADTKTFAADVQTWGAAVIASDAQLSKAITAAYGSDALYNMFNAAVTKAAYKDVNGNLLGIGYSTQSGNPNDDNSVLSGEWTLGAINAGLVLAHYYGTQSPHYNDLIAKTKTMLAGVTAQASNATNGVFPTVSYLYANKRMLIPFGWYSNAVPATASTGWSLMVDSCFNPFQLGGGQQSLQAVCQAVGI
jgi:hypothetical protein